MHRISALFQTLGSDRSLLTLFSLLVKTVVSPWFVNAFFKQAIKFFGYVRFFKWFVDVSFKLNKHDLSRYSLVSSKCRIIEGTPIWNTADKVWLRICQKSLFLAQQKPIYVFWTFFNTIFEDRTHTLDNVYLCFRSRDWEIDSVVHLRFR